MSGEIRLRHGTTLALQLDFQTDDGLAAIDIGTATITAQVRTAAGDIVAALPVVTSGSITGRATIHVTDTTAWPLGTLHSDIKFVQGDGTIIGSETFPIILEREVTL